MQVDTTQLAFTMDVPDGLAIRRVESPIAEAECAVIREQDYFECTNECHDYVDSVAIITLDNLRSAKYPTFVIRSDTSTYDLAELNSMVQTLDSA